MTKRRLNSKINKQLLNIELGLVQLQYTEHARQRCIAKDIQIFTELYLAAGSIVELEWDICRAPAGKTSYSRRL